MDRLDSLLKPNARVRSLRDGAPNSEGRCVLYWMQRAQRGEDNQALNLAIEVANTLKLPVLVAFGLTAAYLGAQRRHYRFMLDAMPEIESALARRNAKLVVRIGSPDEVIAALCEEVQPAVLISDENPVRIGRHWRGRVAEQIQIPFRCVDSDEVVPMSHFPKEEYAARTIRPKMHKLWDDYLKPLSNPKAKIEWRGRKLPKGEQIDPDALLKALKVEGVGEVKDYVGGPSEAKKRLRRFVKKRLPQYAALRNEASIYATSELSAHLHFGHISPITCALAAINSEAEQENIEAFLEELIVRGGLASNFVARNPKYDQLAGCPEWGRKTLADHAGDDRPHLYNAKQLEAAETYDPLWNASQKEMMITGRMHGYMRMYWAKKILEWSPDAESAFSIAVDLNDRYEMDGRDPNGYAGIAWAIGGQHDRPWPERPIFGKIRYMSGKSTGKKFDSKEYIARVERLETKEQGSLF